jgi:predicted nucleic acid-binding protein
MNQKRLIALIDANVLIPVVIGDLLVTLAACGGFTAVLSPVVLEEVVRNQPNSRNRMKNMFDFFSNDIVQILPTEIDKIPTVVNRKDAHLVVAAEKSDSNFIITNDSALTVEVASGDFEFMCIGPWEFLLLVAQAQPYSISAMVEEIAHKRRDPNQWTVDEVWDLILRNGGSQARKVKSITENYFPK